MSKNVFNATFDANNSINRNVFDLSHVNNFTAKIGTIYPVFTKLMPANSSIKIDPQFALRFMPMAFPIQTRMKARLSFFRVPLRTLWKDYADYQGNFKKGLEPPYIDFDTEMKRLQMSSTGSIGDYLGLPTTGSVHSSSEVVGSFSSIPAVARLSVHAGLGASTFSSSSFGSFLNNFTKFDSIHFDTSEISNFTDYSSYIKQGFALVWNLTVNTPASSIRLRLPYFPQYGMSSTRFFLLVNVLGGHTRHLISASVMPDYNFVFSIPKELSALGPLEYRLVYVTSEDGGILKDKTPYDTYSTHSFIEKGELLGAVSMGDVTSFGFSPYFSSSDKDNKKQLKISAYRFRAYESIYNSFYRDNRNNPFMIDGQPEYNKFLPTLDGGVDKNVYSLRRANWEQDFLTTAVQSPQQGIAPLVGLTTYEKVEKGEDGITTVTSSVAIVDESGRKYGLSFNSDADGLKDVKYTELSESEVVKPTRSLFDLAQTGISITDLRNVNAYQKFLELNMRKGYSYKDIIEGRFDVKVKYDELMRPVFIGGMTRDVNVSPVTQSVESPNSNGDYAGALGSQAGLGYVLGDGESITTFCDEESLIMGMMVVVPIPCYSQLLPKDMIYRDLLDHYTPEFNHIGFQPITYAEVCPIQAYSAGKSLQDVFGYQRPWYEYVSETDKVHGLFRTNLHGFLMNRYFNTFPQLSEQFLLVDDKQVNDVFSVTTTDDKILGQIYFNVSAKLPIARVAIPRLD